MSRRYLTILVALSPLLSGSLYWRLTEPAPPTTERHIVRVAVSPSGRWIAAGAASGWIAVFDRETPDTHQRFRGGEGPLRDLRFSRDEQWLIVVNSGQLRHPVERLGINEMLVPGQDPGLTQEDASAAPAAANAERTSNVVPGPLPESVLFGNFAGSLEVRHRASGEILERYTFR